MLSTRSAKDPGNTGRSANDSGPGDAAADAGSSDGGSSDAGSADAGSSDAVSSDAGGGDGRLRDAVAAWVASADQEPGDEGAQGGQGATGRTDEPTEPTEAGATTAEAGEPAETRETTAEAGKPAEAGQADESAGTGETTAAANESTGTRKTTAEADEPTGAPKSAAEARKPAEDGKTTGQADEPVEVGRTTGQANKPTEAGKTTAAANEPAEAGKPATEAAEPTEARKTGAAADQPTETGKTTKQANTPAQAGKTSAAADQPARAGKTTAEAGGSVKGGKTTKQANTPAEAGKTSAAADEPARAGKTTAEAGGPAKAGKTTGQANTPAEAGKTSAAADEPARAGKTTAEAGGSVKGGETAGQADKTARAGKTTEAGKATPAGKTAEPVDESAGSREGVEGGADGGAAGRRAVGRAEVAREAVKDADEPEADRSAKGAAATTDADGKPPTKASKPVDPRASSSAEPASAVTPADEEAEGAPKAAAERPVDQPTAVFKALRPPVDQPTTMLKLGAGTKDLPKSDLPKTDVPKTDVPEKDAERTSKFVALKPLDEPAARKPAPAEATAPVPTVGPERTTQQPLPPKPPLDLLAELTNTPPPPETPLRTAARRVKIWTPLVLLLVVVFAVVQSVRPLPSPTLELTAEDSYTFKGGKVDIPWPTQGQAALDVQGIGTFGSSGEQKPVPIASVAKVMTAYLVLRDHPLKSGEDGPKIPIDQAAQDQSDAGQESTVDVTKGDKITEREALESILIASANNVARLLARWDAGSEKAFVQKMNDAAKDLGMKNTTYTDPSGLNNTTVSTAVDQVKLARAAMQQPAFREVAAMMSYVDYKGTKHDNWNRLVGSNDVTGIKTGTTTSALGNLVFAARKDVNGETHRIIGAVVRQPAGGPDNTILGAALHEGDKLIRAAQGALESATILKKGEVVGYADDGLGGRTPVAVTEDVTAVGWAGLSVKLTFAGDDLPHTAKAGAKVGTLTVGDGTTSAVKVPVALKKDLVEPGFTAKLTRLG
ncbi:D-alanyl-D-alanine carboxypeptidase [Streptomyces sp. NPDC050674]|uniref:D-alanyl-D-alanine carboxypeptidase n=1 Tax=Streptomyces sp. NPDC050674 TaxID=3157216 RepID=UPI0034247176